MGRAPWRQSNTRRASFGSSSPQFALKGKKVDKGVTNVRNTKSRHWRRWLRPQHRCLVPLTAFSEPSRNAEGRYEPVWFALDETRPIAFFAGIFVPGWTSVRKMKEGEVTADLYGFLATEPNAEVANVHPTAMPVTLTTTVEREAWLAASRGDAQRLQRPLADSSLISLPS
ncbi:SOS response-associated peptidase family protein [Roseivivax jejudonensis]|uniref:SOS response-associated peptidase family protein n=1 Tax=Roseivivax jejudonensis TaxID=1529041 RepID=UPI000A2727FB|nr:SOS response-associated peptidase family protein [Roseivivax jejudonensis]